MDTVVEFVSTNIDLKEKNFLEAVALTMVSMVSLSLLPHLQYKYKLFSRVTNGDMDRAADFLALLLIHIGTFKNYAFFESLFTNHRFSVEQWYYFSLFPIGCVSIALGALLVVLSFKKLGLRGMYFGDHFGFFFSKRIDGFPYNFSRSPQYLGTNMIYLGLSLMTRSLSGMLLTIFIVCMYKILWYSMESKKLNEFYPVKYESDESSDSTDVVKKRK
jgi:phosphatidylethanolamine N-methyltransferase